VPSARQLRWYALECHALAHFNLDTYTGREWDDGPEDPRARAAASACTPSSSNHTASGGDWRPLARGTTVTSPSGTIARAEHPDLR